MYIKCPHFLKKLKEELQNSKKRQKIIGNKNKIEELKKQIEAKSKTLQGLP